MWLGIWESFDEEKGKYVEFNWLKGFGLCFEGSSWKKFKVLMVKFEDMWKGRSNEEGVKEFMFEGDIEMRAKQQEFIYMWEDSNHDLDFNKKKLIMIMSEWKKKEERDSHDHEWVKEEGRERQSWSWD